jgi:hypothetical protein
VAYTVDDEAFGTPEPLKELRCHYCVHARAVRAHSRDVPGGPVRRAAGARGAIVAWLCERAPLWVVVHVCALLRDVTDE